MSFVSIHSKEPDRDRALEIATGSCILKGLVGSTVHGLSNPGTDDRDEMGVCIEPREYILGLKRFDHCVARTQPDGEPSGPGDVDLTIYGLRKFVRLAMKGSPTALILFFVRGDDLLECTPAGKQLQDLLPAVLSRKTGRAFLGYLSGQAQKLSEPSASRTREMSVEHGYDTKYAMHALRIGHQGTELLETGTITLPMGEPTRSHLRQVRAGVPSLEEILAEIDDVTAKLESLVRSVELPPDPDHLAVNEFLVETYQSYWRERTSQRLK